MQDVKVLDWRNRHAVQRDVRPRRAGGKVLLGKNVLDEDQLARCLPVPEAIVANRAWEPIRRSGEVTVMAPHTGIEVISVLRVTKDRKCSWQVRDRRELASPQHGAHTILLWNEVPQPQKTIGILRVSLDEIDGQVMSSRKLQLS